MSRKVLFLNEEDQKAFNRFMEEAQQELMAVKAVREKEEAELEVIKQFLPPRTEIESQEFFQPLEQFRQKLLDKMFEMRAGEQKYPEVYEAYCRLYHESAVVLINNKAYLYAELMAAKAKAGMI